MLRAAPQPRGFTLIELMITIALLAFLLLLGVPTIGGWAASASVRSVADGLENALRLAQATAIATNRTTVLALTNSRPAWNASPAANAPNWFVRSLPLTESDESAGSDDYLQGSSIGTQNAVGVTGPALVCFSGLGRQVAKTAAATGMGSACNAAPDDVESPADLTRYTVYTVQRANARTLRVRVYLGGRVRMCDPARALSNSDPDGC